MGSTFQVKGRSRRLSRSPFCQFYSQHPRCATTNPEPWFYFKHGKTAMIADSNPHHRTMLATMLTVLLLFTGTSCVTSNTPTALSRSAQPVIEAERTDAHTPWRYKLGARRHTRPMRKTDEPHRRRGQNESTLHSTTLNPSR